MHCLCFRKPTNAEWIQIQEREDRSELRFVLFDSSLVSWAEQRKLNHVMVALPNSRSMQRKLQDRILEYAHQPDETSGKTVLERLAYKEKFHPWYLLRRLLNAQSIEAFEEYSAIKKRMESMHEHAPVMVFSASDIHAELFSKNVQILKTESRSQSSSKSLGSIIQYFAIILLRGLLGLFRKGESGKHLYLHGSLERQPLFEVEGVKIIQGDPIFEYLHQEVGTHAEFSTMLSFKNYGMKQFPNWSVSLFPKKEIQNHQYFERYILRSQLKSTTRKALSDYRKKNRTKW